MPDDTNFSDLLRQFSIDMRREIDGQNHRLAVIDARIERLVENLLPELKADVAGLQVKSGVWGAVAGGLTALFPVLVGLALALVRPH